MRETFTFSFHPLSQTARDNDVDDEARSLVGGSRRSDLPPYWPGNTFSKANGRRRGGGRGDNVAAAGFGDKLVVVEGGSGDGDGKKRAKPLRNWTNHKPTSRKKNKSKSRNAKDKRKKRRKIVDQARGTRRMDFNEQVTVVMGATMNLVVHGGENFSQELYDVLQSLHNENPDAHGDPTRLDKNVYDYVYEEDYNSDGDDFRPSQKIPPKTTTRKTTLTLTTTSAETTEPNFLLPSSYNGVDFVNYDPSPGGGGDSYEKSYGRILEQKRMKDRLAEENVPPAEDEESETTTAQRKSDDVFGGHYGAKAKEAFLNGGGGSGSGGANAFHDEHLQVILSLDRHLLIDA